MTDHIEDLLLRIGRRCLDVGEFRDDRGELRLVECLRGRRFRESSPGVLVTL
jgi:hypothetical protein